MEIPQLSISGIGLNEKSPSSEDFRAISKSLYEAFTTIGFVYIKDHGIESQVVENAMIASKEFFGKSMKEKKLVSRDSVVQQGYVEVGREVFQPDRHTHEIREAFEVTHIEGELATFPDELVPSLRPALLELASQSMALCQRLLRAFALALGIDENFFTSCHQLAFSNQCATKLRSLYYPPIKEDLPPGVIRCGEHSDYGTFTLLYQDPMGGLEVKAVDESWVKADPIEDAILINAGDLLEIFTNGKIPATLHRVVIPEKEVQLKNPRQSIVLFLHPDHDTVISPLPAFETEEKNPKYEPITALDHLLKRFSATYKY